jgi:predicted dehydrogenase
VNPDLNRRDFLKAGAATAAFTIAQNFSPRSYAANEKIRVGAIGTGGQGSFHLRDGLSRTADIAVVAVCDVYLPHQHGGWQQAGGEKRQITRYFDYRDMLEKEELDAVVIATPLNTHYQITMDCLDAGKYVFCEKTLCYTIEESREIVKKCHETGLFCQVGHQRRYNPKYNKAKWLAMEKGLVGRINHITMQWHRNDDWRRQVDTRRELTAEEKQYIPDLERHINWRLYDEFSGGLMTELATHQLDISQWFLGSYPKRIFGCGSNDYWRDGRDVADNVTLMYEYEISPGDVGYMAVKRRRAAQSQTKINKPYIVRVTYSSISGNAKLGASELIQGDRGSIELTEQDCFIYGEPIIKAEEERMKQMLEKRMSAEDAAKAITSGKSLHLPNDAYKKGYPIEVYNDKSVDQLQFEAFANDIKTGGTPKANQVVGLYTAIAGLKGLEAVRGGGMVEVDPALYKFDFEIPDAYRYEFWEGPEGGDAKPADQTESAVPPDSAPSA